jgi:hypothetical protein
MMGRNHVGWLAMTAIAFIVTGCFSGGLGERCSKETECDSGLRCFKPDSEGRGVCTVGCSSGECESGTCIETTSGDVCASTCGSSDDCKGDLVCQQPTSGAPACWIRDSKLRPLPSESAGDAAAQLSDAAGVGDTGSTADGSSPPASEDLGTAGAAEDATPPEDGSSTPVTGDLGVADAMTGAVVTVARAEFGDDSNEDGSLNPGESGCLRVFAQNEGTSQANSVTARIRTENLNVTIDGASATGDQDFNCGRIDPATIPPGRTSVLLATHFRLDAAAPLSPVEFAVDFADAQGNTWSDRFAVEVSQTGAVVTVARAEFGDDSNEDGSLNPGESGCLRVFAQNEGTSQANSVTARIRTENLNITIDGASATGDQDFNCGRIDPATIPPGRTSVLLATHFRLDAAAPLSPVEFAVDFADAQGNTWSDRFAVEVSQTGAVVTVARAEFGDDSNEDGSLNPGESGCLRVFAQNEGTSQANSVTARIGTENLNITIDGASATGDQDFNCGRIDPATIPPGRTSVLLATHFRLDAAAPLSPVEFAVDFADAQGNTWSDSVTVEVVR